MNLRPWWPRAALLTMMLQGCSDADSPPNIQDEDEHTLVDGGDRRGSDGGKESASDAGQMRDAARSGPAPGRADASVPAVLRDAQVPPEREPAPRDVADSGPSSGCGKAITAATGTFTPQQIRAGERDRSYQLFVPEGYQNMRPYPVVFRFHGRTGNGLSGGLEIERSAAKDAIVVAPDGLNTTWSGGAPDLALFDALVSEIGERYCVDRGRLFAYGFSAGAGFSELLSCVRGDTLRGIAAIAGYEWTRGRSCEGPVAAWLLHDLSDTSAPIAGGRAARDRLLQQNGCALESEPAGESCVRYRDCAQGHPVIWCETDGMGHNIRGDYAPAEAWKFFSTLP